MSSDILLKPEPLARVRARKKRREADVKRRVRAACVERDGYCRWPAGLDPPCDGPSEWAHIGDKRRAKTIGQDPNVRHTLEGTMMLCKCHHGLIDEGLFEVHFRTDVGAQGPVLFYRRERKTA